MLLEQEVSISGGGGSEEQRDAHSHFMLLSSDFEPSTQTEMGTLSDFRSLIFFPAKNPHEKKP